MALTSLELILEYTGVSSIKDITSSNVESLIEMVEQHIKNKTHRNTFESDTVTEYHDGEGKSYFFTDEFPVTAVTSLHDDTDRNYTAGYLIDTDDYVWYSDGRVELETGSFNAGLKNIKIVYTAGYDAVPKDLEYLATKWVVSLLKGKDRIGVSSMSGPDGSVTVFDNFLDADMRAILDNYRSIRF
jgi:hypothetical protein